MAVPLERRKEVITLTQSKLKQLSEGLKDDDEVRNHWAGWIAVLETSKDCCDQTQQELFLSLIVIMLENTQAYTLILDGIREGSSEIMQKSRGGQK